MNTGNPIVQPLFRLLHFRLKHIQYILVRPHLQLSDRNLSNTKLYFACTLIVFGDCIFPVISFNNILKNGKYLINLAIVHFCSIHQTPSFKKDPFRRNDDCLWKTCTGIARNSKKFVPSLQLLKSLLLRQVLTSY